MDEPSTRHRLAIPAFLDLLAAAFGGVAADAFFRGEYGKMVGAGIACLFFFVLGLSWNRLAPSLGKRLISTASQIATDFRWWLAVAFLLFVYFAVPSLSNRHVTDSSNSGAISGVKNDQSNFQHTEYRFPPGDIQALSNEELRQASYALAAQIRDLEVKYGHQHSSIEFGDDIPPQEKAAKLLANEKELSNIFRSKYEDAVFRDESELRRRLNIGPADHFIKSGNISDSAISVKASDLQQWASALP